MTKICIRDGTKKEIKASRIQGTIKRTQSLPQFVESQSYLTCMAVGCDEENHNPIEGTKAW